MTFRYCLNYPLFFLLLSQACSSCLATQSELQTRASTGQQQADTLTLRTEMLTVKDGLSQGLISCIMQDKEGFMWFGTKDGLNKYDGYNFTVYRHQQDNPYSLPDNYIIGMVEDANGNFWVGTHTKGLYIFDKKQEQFYPVKVKGDNESLANNSVCPIAYRNGMLMVQNGELLIYDVSKINPGNTHSVDLRQATVYYDNTKALLENGNVNGNASHLSGWMKDNSLWLVSFDSVLIYKPTASGIYKKAKSFCSSLPGIGAVNDYSLTELPQPGLLLFTNTTHLVV